MPETQNSEPADFAIDAAPSSGFILRAAKYVCGSPLLRKEGCLVYSFGSNGQTSFEEDIIRRAGCAVHVFDPTMNKESIQKVEAVAGSAITSRESIVSKFCHKKNSNLLQIMLVCHQW